MAFAWFRMYAEFASDPVVQSLSFDDQRHFVILLCLKCSGVLDREYADRATRVAVIRRGMGLDALAFDEAKRRLMASGLIESDWQPKNWNKRQFISDHDPTATERKQRQRLKERHGPVTRDARVSHTAQIQNTDTETDSELEKDAWEAVKAAYPRFFGEQSAWLLAERHARQAVEAGESWDAILGGVSRYAAFCSATDRIVKRPDNWFAAKSWREPYEIPPTKSQRKQDANVAASLQWLKESNGTE